jgi:tetratricopeptide (TPR) repeat protein
MVMQDEKSIRKIPDAVLGQVFRFFKPSEVIILEQVSKNWQQLNNVDDDGPWHSYLRPLPDSKMLEDKKEEKKSSKTIFKNLPQRRLPKYYPRLKDYKEAGEFFRKILELYPDDFWPSSELAFFIGTGKLEIKSTDFSGYSHLPMEQRSATVLRSNLTRYPGNTACLYYLGLLIIAGAANALPSDFDDHIIPNTPAKQAKIFFCRVLKINSSHYPALCELGLLFEQDTIEAQAEDFPEGIPDSAAERAAVFYRRVLKVDPRNKKTRSLLARLIAMNQVDAIESDFLNQTIPDACRLGQAVAVFDPIVSHSLSETNPYAQDYMEINLHYLPNLVRFNSRFDWSALAHRNFTDILEQLSWQQKIQLTIIIDQVKAEVKENYSSNKWRYLLKACASSSEGWWLSAFPLWFLIPLTGLIYFLCLSKPLKGWDFTLAAAMLLLGAFLISMFFLWPTAEFYQIDRTVDPSLIIARVEAAIRDYNHRAVYFPRFAHLSREEFQAFIQLENISTDRRSDAVINTINLLGSIVTTIERRIAIVQAVREANERKLTESNQVILARVAKNALQIIPSLCIFTGIGYAMYRTIQLNFPDPVSLSSALILQSVTALILVSLSYNLVNFFKPELVENVEKSAREDFVSEAVGRI